MRGLHEMQRVPRWDRSPGRTTSSIEGFTSQKYNVTPRGIRSTFTAQISASHQKSRMDSTWRWRTWRTRPRYSWRVWLGVVSVRRRWGHLPLPGFTRGFITRFGIAWYPFLFPHQCYTIIGSATVGRVVCHTCSSGTEYWVHLSSRPSIAYGWPVRSVMRWFSKFRLLVLRVAGRWLDGTPPIQQADTTRFPGQGLPAVDI